MQGEILSHPLEPYMFYKRMYNKIQKVNREQYYLVIILECVMHFLKIVMPLVVPLIDIYDAYSINSDYCVKKKNVSLHFIHCVFIGNFLFKTLSPAGYLYKIR